MMHPRERSQIPQEPVLDERTRKYLEGPGPKSVLVQVKHSHKPQLTPTMTQDEIAAASQSATDQDLAEICAVLGQLQEEFPDRIRFKRFDLVNGLGVSAPGEVIIDHLATRPDVQKIYPNIEVSRPPIQQG